MVSRTWRPIRHDGPMRPMLASAGTVIPGGPDWVHEIKWDGMRVLVDVADYPFHLNTVGLMDCTAPSASRLKLS